MNLSHLGYELVPFACPFGLALLRYLSIERELLIK